MGKAKRTILAAACAAALVVGSVAATVAYLTSTDTVTNTFTVGNVSIKLDEAKVNTDGSLVAGADRVKANTYKLLPGHTYNKDPMVTVLKGSESSYVKLDVVVSKSAELDAIGVDLLATFKGYDSASWIYRGNVEDATANTRTYEFWYKEPVAAPDADVALDALFNQIVVPGTITNEQLATLCKTDSEGKMTSQMTITVNAYAIQADGFNDAASAWEAFDEQV